MVCGGHGGAYRVYSVSVEISIAESKPSPIRLPATGERHGTLLGVRDAL